MTDDYVVLIPWRGGDDRRTELLHHVRSRLARDLNVPVYVGTDADWTQPDLPPFNRSRAVNQAAAQAGDNWKAALVVDADTIVPSHQALAGLYLAEPADRIVFAFERYRYVGEKMTRRILAGYDGDWLPGVEWTTEHTCSSAVAVGRTLWDEVGGFDEGFVGWGFEDVAFSLACQAMRGGHGHFHRVAGDVWHLWHSSAPAAGDDQHPIWQANQRRMVEYATACEGANPHTHMRALLDRVKAGDL